MRKVVMFTLFASLMLFASVKSTTEVHPSNATVKCCDPPPECPPEGCVCLPGQNCVK